MIINSRYSAYDNQILMWCSLADYQMIVRWSYHKMNIRWSWYDNYMIIIWISPINHHIFSSLLGCFFVCFFNMMVMMITGMMILMIDTLVLNNYMTIVMMIDTPVLNNKMMLITSMMIMMIYTNLHQFTRISIILAKFAIICIYLSQFAPIYPNSASICTI